MLIIGNCTAFYMLIVWTYLRTEIKANAPHLKPKYVKKPNQNRVKKIRADFLVHSSLKTFGKIFKSIGLTCR